MPELLHTPGKPATRVSPLSYNNNLLDTDAAHVEKCEFDDPSVILKHQNPCGSATVENVVKAYDRAFACDPPCVW